MNGYFWLPQRAGVPGPGEVAAYLRGQGWNVLDMAQVKADWATYQKVFSEQTITLEVPQRAFAMDYPRALRILVDDLARIEERTASAIVRDMKAASLDIVRLAIDSPMTRDGRIPVEAGRRVFEASRDLLLAAACSVLDPRPVFSKRKPDEAMKLLDRVRFGQTEVGSFVVTMESGIPPRLQTSLFPDDLDSDAPLERKTSIRLANALQEAEIAARQSSASSWLDPFSSRTKDGVSANLCEAVAEMIEATEADTITASFLFATGRPPVVNAPKTVYFSADVAPIFREAARGLRQVATYPQTEVVGPVVKLDSMDPKEGGEAVLKAEIDGRYRSIRVGLDPTLYSEAIVAHKERQLVRCTGDLTREGQSLILRNARDFVVLAD